MIGYLVSFEQEPAERKVLALGTGQRNPAADLLVAAFGFGADTSVVALAASQVLTVVMHFIAAEWGRRTTDALIDTWMPSRSINDSGIEGRVRPMDEFIPLPYFWSSRICA